jgi:hypothetical protein
MMGKACSLHCKRSVAVAFLLLLLSTSSCIAASGTNSATASLHIQVFVASTVQTATATPVAPVPEEISTNQAVIYNLAPISSDQSVARISREETPATSCSPDDSSGSESSVIVETLTVAKD